MREYFEDRRVLADLTDMDEKLGTLLNEIEDVIGFSEDYKTQKLFTDIYREVVKARGAMRKAEQMADEYLADELTGFVTPIE